MSNRIEIPSLGFVELVNSCADDLSVVNSARVSLGKKKEFMDEGDEKLIHFLMREHHGTPFEHNFFCFHIKAPIFVVREWFRHRIGWSYNELSGRYSELPEEFYIPDVENVRGQTGKPGAYRFAPLPEGMGKDIADVIDTTCRSAHFMYQQLLAAGVAKELARTVLPVGTYTEFYASTNARALMNFLTLRGSITAQYEIRQYAHALGELLDSKMPITYDAFIANGAIAP